MRGADRSPERLRALGTAVAGILGAVVIGAAVSAADDQAGLLIPVAAVAGLGVAAVVFWQPMLGVYGAILAVPLEFAKLQFGSSFSLSPTKALILVTGAAVLARLVLSERRPAIARAHVAFGCFLVIGALGLVVAKDHLVTERILVVWTAVWLACIWVADADLEQVRRVMICIAVSGAVLGILALAGTGPQELGQSGAVATNRATGSFTHPNQLGDYMVLALPVAIVLTGETRGWLRIAMFACIVPIVAGLALTLARGAILGAVVAAIVLLAWPAYRRVLLAGLAVVAVIAVASPSLLHAQELQTLTTRIGTVEHVQQTAGSRPLIWGKTPHIIADHPLIGIGLGNFQNVSPKYGALDVGGLAFDHAHDVALTIAAETGLLGFAFFAWFVASTALAGWRALMGRASTRTKLALGLMAAFAGTFVIGLTDDPLVENADFAVTMIEAALLIALGRQAAAEVVRAGARSRTDWWRPGLPSRLWPERDPRLGVRAQSG